ncbi:MAG: TetR/AcrR family transcriptional regulator [Kineosporiaceae bacterium]
MTSRPARLTRRQEQGEQSRNEILDAAARLMAAKGFDGASISSISKESGLPASSIYWHFTSKEGVLAAVMERGADRFFAELDPGAVPPDASPVDHLRAEFGIASAAIRRDPGFLRLFILLLLSGRDDETVRRVRRVGRERVHGALRRAFDAEGASVAEAVADELADVGLAMFDGAFLAVQNDPTLDYEPLLMTMADALAALGQAGAARHRAGTGPARARAPLVAG